MTDKQLAEIEARAAKATPGPWVAAGEEYIDELPDGLWLEPSVQVQAEAGKTRTLATIHVGTGVDEDADFIAHAREDIPELIAHIRKLEVERLTADEREVVLDALGLKIDALESDALAGRSEEDVCTEEAQEVLAVRAKIEAMGGDEG